MKIKNISKDNIISNIASKTCEMKDKPATLIEAKKRKENDDDKS